MVGAASPNPGAGRGTGPTESPQRVLGSTPMVPAPGMRCASRNTWPEVEGHGLQDSEFATCARLAQSVERQALNLMVVGSSPTVGVFNVCCGSNVAS